VVQYVDDTLIIAKASTAGVAQLRSALDAFSNSIGIHINYHKSTIVPIHVAPTTIETFTSILHCKLSSFPLSYLGLLFLQKSLTSMPLPPAHKNKHVPIWMEGIAT
jgi:hypothetical protein